MVVAVLDGTSAVVVVDTGTGSVAVDSNFRVRVSGGGSLFKIISILQFCVILSLAADGHLLAGSASTRSSSFRFLACEEQTSDKSVFARVKVQS